MCLFSNKRVFCTSVSYWYLRPLTGTSIGVHHQLVALFFIANVLLATQTVGLPEQSRLCSLTVCCVVLCCRLQVFLNTYGIQTQTPQQVEPIQIWAQKELVNVSYTTE